MHGLQACLFKYSAAKGEVKGRAFMEITLLIMENHKKNHGIVFLNFCGNPD